VKSRPILFGGPMIRALLAGTKSQTRRVVKPQPGNPEVFGVSPIWGSGVRHDSDRFEIHAAFDEGGKRVDRWLACPYGAPGDQLWVKETFFHEPATYIYEASVSIPAVPATTLYRADLGDDSDGPWKPSIFMPRWASRITLEVTDVRVERLQDISEEDAIAEGVERFESIGPDQRLPGTGERFGDAPYRCAYACLWDEINGAGSWKLNPWVWVVSFRRMP
jgi:hypothetical protein